MFKISYLERLKFLQIMKILYSAFLITMVTLWSCQGTGPEHTEPLSDFMELELEEGTNMAASLSPDGSTIAFDLVGRIWLMPAEGGDARPITDSLGNARQPIWSPDGNQLTFQAYWDGNWHVYLVNKDGSNLRQVTSGDFDHREPFWSPDGGKIAFSSDRSGNYDIWTLDLVGEQLENVSGSEGNEHSPSWSPDGSQLAYVSEEQGSGSIMIRSMGSDQGEKVYEGKGKLTGVSWSPSADKLIFNEQTLSESKLISIGLGNSESSATIAGGSEDVFPFRPSWISDSSFVFTSSGKIKKGTIEGITNDIPFKAKVVLDRASYDRKKRDFDSIEPQRTKGIVWPSLSPDGNRVAFTALQDLWIRNQDGSLRQLTNDAFVQTHPIWSPDGMQIAYSSDHEGPFGIYSINVETGNIEMILETGGSISGMSWSPDGNMIAFTRSFGPAGGQLSVVDVNSGEARSIGKPLGSSPGTPTWSPDGKTLALTTLDKYSSLYREGVNRIILFKVDGTEQRMQEAPEHWSFGARSNDGPVWSPDGKYMAVMGMGTLWLLPVDENGNASGDPTRITDELSEAPTWSGDSKKLLYMATDQLKIVDVETRATETLPIDLQWTRKIPQSTLVIHVGGLIDGVSNELKENVDVVINGHRIVEIVAHDDSREADIKVDASDAYLMPGLMDAHAHEGSTMGESLGRAWLSWGVTGMRSPASDPYDMLNRREAIQSGKALGPRIYFTGSPIDGSRIYYGGGQALQSEDQIEMELARAEALDYDLIKTYVRLPDPLQRRVIEGAHKIGLPVYSHELYPAVTYNIDGVEHQRGTSRRGFSTKISETLNAYEDVIQLLSQKNLSWTPTIAIYYGYNYLIYKDTTVVQDERLRAFAPFRINAVQGIVEEVSKDPEGYEKIYRNELKMAKDVHDNGGFITAGTDSPIIPQGFGLHMELQTYQDAGLTPFEVLQTATVNNARLFNLSEDFGSVEVGKIADLVIVEANPLEDIRNARKVRMVIKNGEVISLEDLLQRPAF